MQNSSVESRREAVVTRLNAARESYKRCFNGVAAEAAFIGSEWSVADLLRHVNGGLFRALIMRLLDEDTPQLGSFDRQVVWDQLMETSIANIDEALNIANTLTPEQMVRAGERNSKPYSSLDAIEAWATHLEDHLAQLRDEIRPREGLPPV